jgi:hypothetical protein
MKFTQLPISSIEVLPKRNHNRAILIMAGLGSLLIVASVSFCYAVQSSALSGPQRAMGESSLGAQTETGHFGGLSTSERKKNKNWNDYGNNNGDSGNQNNQDKNWNDYGNGNGNGNPNSGNKNNQGKNWNDYGNGNANSGNQNYGNGGSTSGGSSSNVNTNTGSTNTGSINIGTTTGSTGSTTTTTTTPTTGSTTTTTPTTGNTGSTNTGGTNTATPTTGNTGSTTTGSTTTDASVITYQSGQQCTNGKTAYYSGLTADQKAVVLKAHNDFRAKIALGNAPGQPGATDMLEMVWDDSIATVAQTWADTCAFDHDDDNSRVTSTFDYLGQNLYITQNSAKQTKLDLTTLVKGWYDEVDLLNGAAPISSYQFDENTGHYTQLAWAKSYALGCGFKVYKDSGMYSYQLTCNYGPGGNFIGDKIYTKGTFNAANCKNGASTSYNGLCKN